MRRPVSRSLSRVWRGGRTASREITFIVVGVLIALGANSWWEGRQDRDRTTEYLLRLAEDLNLSRDAMEATDESRRSVVDGTRGVMRLLRAGPTGENVDSLRATLGWIAVFNMTPVHDGTYQEMMATGALRLLRSDSLRAALRAYESALAYHRVAEAFSLQQYHGRVEPFLAREVVYSDVAALGYRTALGASPFAHDYRPLFRNVELWNIASLKLESELFLEFTARRLSEALEEAHRLVVAELARIDPALADAAAKRATTGGAPVRADLEGFLEGQADGKLRGHP